MNCFILLLLLSCCRCGNGCSGGGCGCMSGDSCCRREGRRNSDRGCGSCRQEMGRKPGCREERHDHDGCGCREERHDHDGCGCCEERRDHDGCGCREERHDHDGCGCREERRDHDGCDCRENDGREMQGMIPPPWQEYPRFPRRDGGGDCES